MPCTSVYDFINGGTIALSFPRAPAAETQPAHGLRVLLTPDAAAAALLRKHAELLAAQPKAH